MSSQIREIKSIGIIGSGSMGLGIAEHFLIYGYDVSIIDTNTENLDKGTLLLREKIQKYGEKNNLSSQETESIIDRSYFAQSYTLLKERDIDFVLEAVYEDMDVKSKVFKSLIQNMDENVILATNTSSLSIGNLASSIQNAERFLGVHFFNPVKHMPLVEIIPHSTTHISVVERVKSLIHNTQKVGVVCKDSTGFIVNKLLIPMINQAGQMLDQGIATASDIDTAMILGSKMPMGPLKLADFIGLDIIVAIQNVFYNEEKNDFCKPAQCFTALVEKGCLGLKTKKGIYDYE